MPSFEPVASILTPKTPIETPIPTRTVVTKSPLQTKKDQVDTSRSEPAAESAKPAESVRLSPQLSALARKEQAYRQREQALKAREKELESKLAQAEQYSQLKSKLDSKDYSKAEELGMTYEGYTQYLLNKQAGEDPNTEAFRRLESEIQALKKGQEDKATSEYEETVAEYKKEIEALVNSNPEYSSVKELGRTDAVLQLILDSWEEDGTELTVEQASKDIEDYLVDQASKMAALPKLKPKVEEGENKKLPPPRSGSKTLNQTMAAVGTNPKPYKSLQHLSESERYAEARRRVLERREAK